jgi:acyl dehydratase
MSLNLSMIGKEFSSSEERSWTSKDTLLYALGVGAGSEDLTSELAFTTENSHDTPQQVLPTFAAVLPAGTNTGLRDLGDFSLRQILHAEQGIRLYGPLPPAGTIRSTSRIANMYDKGANALIVMEAEYVDASSGQPLAATTTGIMVRGEGGFGGERGPSSNWTQPERAADYSITYQTRPDQALLYRLSGDRNPLHSDPWFAQMAGFPRPILHGLCTYGFTGRALLHLCCGGDPARFGSMQVRFSRPVLPGQKLQINAWEDGDRVLFQTRSDTGDIVIDHGVFTRRAQ